jgi:uncharacterized protein
LFFADNDATDASNLRIKLDMNNIPSLLYAVKEDHLPTVTHLFENFESAINIEGKDRQGMTPLLVAVSNNNVPMTGYLISKGADVHASEKEQRTALHIAACNGNLPLVILLAHKGANIAAVDGKERTALHIAASLGNLSIVEFLVKNNRGLIEAKNKYRETALFEAVVNGHVQVVDFLLSKGASVSKKAKVGSISSFLCVSVAGCLVSFS